MSQLLTARIANPDDTSVSRRAQRFRAAKRVFQAVFSAVALICVAASTTFSQQVQTVKSGQPMICDGKDYQLRLVTAGTTLGTKNAKALAIVLTPSGTAESSLFGVYWIDVEPKRDDTTGRWEGDLRNYGNGLARDGQPVVSSFFSTLKCSSSDPQTMGLVQVLNPQNLSATGAGTPINFEDVAQQLTAHGVKINPDEIKEASSASLNLFHNLQDENEFAKAIRQYVAILLSEEGRNDNAGYTPETQNKIAALVTHNRELSENLKTLQAEKAQFLGGAPRWLTIVFPFMVSLSVGGLILIGIAIYHLVRHRRLPSVSTAFGTDPPPKSQRRRESDQLPLDRLETMITSARERRLKIGKTYASLEQTVKAQSQMPKTPEALAETIFRRMNVNLGSRDQKHSKAVMREVLQPVNTIATESPKRAAELDEAHADLLDQLEALASDPSQLPRTDSSATVKSSSSTPTQAPTPGEQAIILKLDVLTTAFNAMKLSSEQVAPNVEQRMEQIAARLKNTMDQDAGDVKELKAIRESLTAYFGRDVKPWASVTDLIEDQSTAQQKLRRYHPGRNFPQTVDAVVSTYEAILNKTEHVLPEQTTSIRERVSSLVDEYRVSKREAERAAGLESRSKQLQAELDAVSSEVQAAKKLANEITVQLNFNADSSKHSDEHRVAATLNRLRSERESSPYLQLRMGLSSAMIALEKAISTNGTPEHQELIEALFLNNVKSELKALLGKMEECSGDQLWTDVLYEGFNEQWLHNLIRADLLLRTYYSTGNEFSLLRKAVSLACTSILAALHEFQVEVIEVGLFDKLPTNMEKDSVYAGLRNLPAVMDKVGLMVQNTKVGDLVIDVTSFPLIVKGVQENRGCAVIANPSAWLQQ